MVDRGRFAFFDEWRPAAPGDPRGGGPRPGEVRVPVPYASAVRHGLRREVLRDDPLVGVETRVIGRVAGQGSWRVEPIDGGTLVHFDWEVRPQLAWMRAVAPLARPVFRWNHRSLMAEGAFGLARHLDTRLLAAPVGVLLPA